MSAINVIRIPMTCQNTFLRYFSILLFGLLTLSACRQSDDVHLVVLSTTDVHGNFLPFDFETNREASVSLANVSSYVKEQRLQYGEQVLLFDIGDLIQGSPSMYYYNFEAIRVPHLAAKVVNYMGYDALTLGNHDLEPGEHVYHDRLPMQFHMPWLCANAIDSRTNQPMFTPYTVFERQGVRVAVIGFVNPNIHRWLPKSTWPNLKFLNMEETAAVWIPTIEREVSPDLIIGLFHAGSDEDFLTNNPLIKEESAIPTITNVRGFDLAILGHDHKTREDFITNNYGDTVYVLEAAAHTVDVGRADIHVTRDADGVRVQMQLSRIPMNRYPADPAFDDLFGADRDSVNHYLNRPLGYVSQNLDGEGCLIGQTNMMDFVHRVQLDVTQSDISFASAVSTFSDIPSGPLTMRQLFTMYRYENQLHKMWMSGADVKRFLEYGYANQFNQMENRDDYLLSFQTDQDGNLVMGAFGPELQVPQYNFTSAAGIDYVVDVRRDPGHRVTILSMADGRPFDEHQTYSVVLSSYQAAGGGGFISEGLGWSDSDIRFHTLTQTSKDMRYYIAEYIQRTDTIHPQPYGKWVVEPRQWWENVKDRDVEILLPYITEHKNNKTNLIKNNEEKTWLGFFSSLLGRYR